MTDVAFIIFNTTTNKTVCTAPFLLFFQQRHCKRKISQALRTITKSRTPQIAFWRNDENFKIYNVNGQAVDIILGGRKVKAQTKSIRVKDYDDYRSLHAMGVACRMVARRALSAKNIFSLSLVFHTNPRLYSSVQFTHRVFRFSH